MSEPNYATFGRRMLAFFSLWFNHFVRLIDKAAKTVVLRRAPRAAEEQTA